MGAAPHIRRPWHPGLLLASMASGMTAPRTARLGYRRTRARSHRPRTSLTTKALFLRAVPALTV